MDIFAKCYEFQRAREAIAGGYYPYFIPLSENEGTEVTFQGHRLIMIGSNNYLGLTTDPRVKAAAIEATNLYGTSCTGSRFLNGTLALHHELEQEVADFVGKEAAMVLSTGFQANLGAVSALLGRHDIVILDREDHASIVDGARLGLGQMCRFRHNDAGHLGKILGEIDPASGTLVVMEGVYSFSGDIAPLDAIVSQCQAHGARLILDDAHSIGVLGNGHGTAAQFGLTDQVDLITGTFSKSLASLGGFVAGDDQIIHYIKHFARSMIYSASIPAGNAAAALTALRILRAEPERVARVNEIGARMRQGFRALGFDVGASATPIIPILLGDDLITLAMWRGLFDAGVFVNPVLSPAVLPQDSRLRTSFMATHTDEQLDRVLNIFQEVGHSLGVI